MSQPISAKHILRQKAVIFGLLRLAAGSAGSRFRKTPRSTIPGNWIHQHLRPRNMQLVRDYILWTGGDVSRYQNHLPPHFFTHWGFPVLAKTLHHIPYPATRILNQGCRIRRNGDMPSDQPLQVKARLEEIAVDENRARLHQQIVTGTAQSPDAMVCDIYAIVKLSSGANSNRKPAILPNDVEVIGSHQFPKHAGLDFAKLTGDFNPIHWVKPMAKLSGFPTTIMHGFGLLAVTIETLNRHLQHKGQGSWRCIDVRFIKALTLPNLGTIYLGKSTKPTNDIFLTNSKGKICMIGSVEIAQ